MGILLVLAALMLGDDIALARSRFIVVTPKNLHQQGIPLEVTHWTSSRRIYFHVVAKRTPSGAGQVYGELVVPGQGAEQIRGHRKGEALEWDFSLHLLALPRARFTIVAFAERMPAFTAWKLPLLPFVPVAQAGLRIAVALLILPGAWAMAVLLQRWRQRRTAA